MDKIKVTIITLLVALLFGTAVYLGQSQKRILVIHSFNANSAWVKQINHGIDTYLKNNGEVAGKVSIDYYYMDMESPIRQKCEAYLTEMRNAEKILEDREPDIVIISDDIAQRLIGIRLATFQSSKNDYLKRNADWLIKNGSCSNNQDIKENLISEMRSLSLTHLPEVIFTGIDNDAEEYGYQDAANVTGIFEHRYMASVKETLQDLYRAIPESSEKPAKVTILSGKSSMTDHEKKRMRSDLLSISFNVPLKWSGLEEVSTWGEWKEAVLQANQNQAMIFIAGYGDIAREQTEESVVRWTEACAQYPVLGSSASFITAGGMLTNTVSGREQGQVAMDFVKQRLDSSNESSRAEWKEPRQFTVGMNKALFDKRGLFDFPLVYKSFSRESDNYQDYKYDYQTDCQ